MFTTVEVICDLNQKSKKTLLNLYYQDKRTGRSDRFKLENGTLKVNINYLYPHREKLEKLYFIALQTVSGNEKALARIVAKALSKNEWTVYMYFRNFKFKNPKFAKQVIRVLKKHIKNNHLFLRANYD